MITWPIIELFVADICPFATVLACVVTTVKWRANDARLAARLVESPTYAMQYHGALRAVCVCFLVVQSVAMAGDAFRLSVRAGGVSLVQWTPRLEAQQRLAGVVILLAQQLLALLKPIILFVMASGFRNRVAQIVFCRKSQETPSTTSLTSKTNAPNGNLTNRRRTNDQYLCASHAHKETGHSQEENKARRERISRTELGNGRHDESVPAQLTGHKRTHYATTSV